METIKSTRVLLADDHPLIIAGFAMSLSGYGIEIVGEARTPEDVVEKYQELLPDVLILDIRFGEHLTGLDAAKEVLKRFPTAKIVFLSQFDQTHLIKEAYRIGGFAFVTKACDPEQLATAIKYAQQGKQYVPSQIAERLAFLTIQGDTSPQSKLETREIEIFTLMAQGLTNTEIADKLNLSLRTISNTSQTIKEKLGIHRAADITRLGACAADGI